MVLGALVGGLGAGAIDAGLNTYAAAHYSTRSLNWLHACFGIGAAAGPVIMTLVLMHALPWQRGYLLVVGAQLALALAFAATRRRWAVADHAGPASLASTFAATLRLPATWLSIGVFFAYTGLEAAAGLWSYSLFTEARHVRGGLAGGWVSLYWAALTPDASCRARSRPASPMSRCCA